MAEYKVDEVMDRLMKGMGGFLSTKTVVGEPLQVGDATLIPLVEVSFARGAGTGTAEKRGTGGGGMGGKMTPSAVLVIRDGKTRLINIKNQDSMTKILDMIPDVVNRFTEPKPGSNEIPDEKAVDIAFDRTENN